MQSVCLSHDFIHAENDIIVCLYALSNIQSGSRLTLHAHRKENALQTRAKRVNFHRVFAICKRVNKCTNQMAP